MPGMWTLSATELNSSGHRRRQNEIEVKTPGASSVGILLSHVNVYERACFLVCRPVCRGGFRNSSRGGGLFWAGILRGGGGGLGSRSTGSFIY